MAGFAEGDGLSTAKGAWDNVVVMASWIAAFEAGGQNKPPLVLIGLQVS